MHGATVKISGNIWVPPPILKDMNVMTIEAKG